MSPGKCRPQSHSGRSAIEVSVLASPPGRAPDRVHQHERADTVGVVVGEADGDAAPKRVPHHHHLLLQPDDAQERVEPAPIAAEREVLARQVVGAGKAREGGGPDPSPLRRDPLDHLSIGVVAEAPAVEQHDGQTVAGQAVERRPVVHPGALPHHRGRPGRGASPASPGLSPVVASSPSPGSACDASPGLTPPSQASSALLGQQLLALELVQASPDAMGLTDPEGVLEARLADGALRADGLGPAARGRACPPCARTALEGRTHSTAVPDRRPGPARPLRFVRDDTGTPSPGVER